MAEPTNKAEAIDNAIHNIFGVNRRENIRTNTCTMCEADATEFRDTLSEKEFCISGMCQTCQDNIFRNSDLEDWEYV